MLAAALPVLSKDKLSYTIQLRKGIKFNDGTPFNAQAVVTTVQRYMTLPRLGRARATSRPSTASPRPGRTRSSIHLKARRLDVHVGNPYVLSPTQLAKLGDDFGTNPVCVGPFMFDHRVVGDNVTVIKSPYYYDQKDVYLDKIVFKPMPDAAAAAAALKAGDIQVLDRSRRPSCRASGRLEPAGDPGAPARLDGRPHQHRQQERRRQPAVRERRHAARVEREAAAGVRGGDRPNALNRVVFGGLDQVSCTPISPANTAGTTRQGPVHAVRPEDAKKLVAASGFPNPTVHLLTTTRTDRSGWRSSSRRRRRRSGSTS